MNSHKKVGNRHANVRVCHSAKMDVDALLSHASLFQGRAIVFKRIKGDFRLLDSPGHMNVDVTKEKLEGIHIFHEGLTRKVHRVRLDAVKEPGGKPHRGFNLGSPQVLGHDGRCGAVIGTDVHERGFRLGGRMVVNDDIKVDPLKILMVIRLGVEDGIPGKLALIDLFYWKQVELEQSDHGQVVGSRDRVYVGDGGGGDLSPQ